MEAARVTLIDRAIRRVLTRDLEAVSPRVAAYYNELEQVTVRQLISFLDQDGPIMDQWNFQTQGMVLEHINTMQILYVATVSKD